MINKIALFFLGMGLVLTVDIGSAEPETGSNQGPCPEIKYQWADFSRVPDLALLEEATNFTNLALNYTPANAGNHFTAARKLVDSSRPKGFDDISSENEDAVKKKNESSGLLILPEYTQLTRRKTSAVVKFLADHTIWQGAEKKITEKVMITLRLVSREMGQNRPIEIAFNKILVKPAPKKMPQKQLVHSNPCQAPAPKLNPHAIDQKFFIDKAEKIALLLGNYSPDLAPKLFQQVAGMVAPGDLEHFEKNVIEPELKVVKESSMTHLFSQESSFIQRRGDAVVVAVTGTQTMKAASETFPPGPKTYEVTMVTGPRHSANRFGIYVTKVELLDEKLKEPPAVDSLTDIVDALG